MITGINPNQKKTWKLFTLPPYVRNNLSIPYILVELLKRTDGQGTTRILHKNRLKYYVRTFIYVCDMWKSERIQIFIQITTILQHINYFYTKLITI